MAKIQGPKEGKHILIFTTNSGPNSSPWAQKSTMRFMRTLGPSSTTLAQSSWSLLLMALHFLGDANPLKLIEEKNVALKKTQERVDALLEEFNELKVHAKESKAYAQ
ncbi:hypothetical protein GmHk_U059735 [Glycine max]|nr:hypothetical protein GmHk_U059735 [Glycine max]